MDKLENFLKKNQYNYSKNGKIHPYLTLKIGNGVKYITEVDSKAALLNLLNQVQQEDYPFILLGGGSNVVFSDEFSKLLVIVNKTSSIEKLSDNLVRVGSGLANATLLKWCVDNQVGGLDFLAGIPGTVGGAAAVNAGAFGRSISQVLVEAEIWRGRGEVETVSKDFFNFQYRDSTFKYGNQVILDMLLKIEPDQVGTIGRKIRDIINYRKANHPAYKELTAGCFFRNPIQDNKKISAGKLIESSGLKGLTIDQLQVSQKHANFIINKGQADFNQVRKIEMIIVDRVKAETGVQLNREVIYISSQGKKY